MMTMIPKAIIIDEPWISAILDGSKTWEMRSKDWSYRGWLGLIKKGSGKVWGIARLIDIGKPLSPEELIATFEKHSIPEQMIRSGAVANWTIPWKLADIHHLPRPVSYRHNSGATVQVNLDPDVSAEIMNQLGMRANIDKPIDMAEPSPISNTQELITMATPIAPVSCSAGSGTLIGKTEINQANITHNHIYLRGFFHHFPKDVVGGSNRHEKAMCEVTVDWGSHPPVQTDLDGVKKMFRARGWVGPFFKMNKAKVGDTIVVIETAPYCYRVRIENMSGLSL